MNLAPGAVELAVRAAFPDTDAASIMALLDTYGVEPHERERQRVQLAIVELCAGDPGRVAAYVGVAKTDYRDILAWAAGPPPTAEDAARDLAAVDEILRRWGRR